MQDFDEGEAHLKSNDYTQPRYLPQNINYCMLTDDQMKGTIFENFQLSELLHRIPRETLRSNNITFVREDKLNQIELVRQQISVDMTAIRDALCNLNLSILPVEQVDQIASIAPSVIDVSYLLNYESMEPALVIGENEQFLLKLAKIDRVAEKLHAMSFMGHINSRTTEILKSLEDLISATNALRKNRGFHVLIRVVLVFINFIIGDYAAKTSRGFRISDLTKICSTEVCSSPKTTLLNVVASCTISEFTEVCMIRDTLPALEKASRVNFQELSVTIRRLEQDYLRFDREVSYMDSERHVSACRESIKNKVTEVKESFQECKTILCKTMRYFGEFVDDDIGVEIPEAFFAAVATFCRQLQRAWIDVHLHGIQGTKAVQ
ncbi:unnamed protein product [Thelazia callipaeda]|uniref:FH2 domain-containing protein n=1 Tax=Thelazia callipaeda TaxID=103827 RepID=A0A0N5DCF1_THECL|nr:unnamed protein product [Thelazia callipaeda]